MRPEASQEPAAPDRRPAQVVEELGRRMKGVSTLAPPESAAKAIGEAYAGLVDPDLLARWEANPATAPGRQVSSPWPERIEVERVTDRSENTAVVRGRIVEVSSSGQAGRVPVLVTLERQAGSWLVTDFRAGPNDSDDAVEVVNAYYRAISARDFRRAYQLWGPSGPPDQTLEEFTRGFADTASVRVETGEPSRVEPAAGSRYIDVPVRIFAETKSGEKQSFEGIYTLRRSVVDGASPEQQRWHLYRASIG